MVVHLIDGTYELFRHFYGLRRFTKGEDRPYGAVVGVLPASVIEFFPELHAASRVSPASPAISRFIL